MLLFRYSAVDRTGARIDGEMRAENRSFVLDHLTHRGILPVEVEAVGGAAAARAEAGGLFHRQVSKDDITILTRELAMLLKAGLTLDAALALLEQDESAPRRARLIGRIRFALDEGRDFAEALEAQGAAFPAIYCNMVRVAEATGTLDSVLGQIAAMREREQKLRAKIISAALYPGLLITASIVMITLLLVFVVPRFKDMITSADAEIPQAARLVIAASDWLNANWQLLLVVLLSAGLAFVLAWGRPTLRRALERLFLRLPVIGHFARTNITIRLCRTLGTLLKSGVDLPEALALSQRVVGAGPAANAVGAACEALRKGQSFITPLTASGLFPSVVTNMLKVGEETGNLAPSAHYLGEMFEDKLDLGVQRLMTILEPLIILLVAAFVAGIIIAILGAVISVNDLAL